MSVIEKEPAEAEARASAETAPPRIAPLALLPLFHRIEGRKALVVGASDGALWKAELLAAAGANVLVLAGNEAEKFEALAAQPPAGTVTVEGRDWTVADLDGAALAVADLGDAVEAGRFSVAARAAGVPVNVVDRTDACDVLFGSIVNRSPVVIAISTDGGSPMLGQSIRTRIESVLPSGIAAWADAARRWRPLLKAKLGDFADRRAFWERFVRHAWTHVDRLPGEADRDVLLRAGEEGGAQGRVILVGAGPGDPELLTLKAVRALQAATVILYDQLVDPRVLELARREARRVAVGKKGYGPSCRQSDINAEIVALAAAGETVVRLKGGDPLIFGRATEEVEACRAAGIAVEIVPGISAAQGAAAALGFSLTERHVARRIQFVTGHAADGKLPQDIDWSAVADPLATTVVYMPRKTLGHFVERAVAEGLDPEIPAVAIADATRDSQAWLSGTLAELPSLAERLDPSAPVTVIVGKVVRAAVAEPVLAVAGAEGAAR
jgi:uroporphyrin-III C-methyltransferase/precorrin-2 dehydrogenase/sirohydrochlorin ferrochelatase